MYIRDFQAPLDPLEEKRPGTDLGMFSAGA